MCLGSSATQLQIGSPASVGLSETKLEQAAELLKSAVQSDGVGAAAILVARSGRIVLHKGFGRLSNSAKALAVQPNSVFLVASLTKPVTAASLMLLVERGMVSLSDPVGKYLPDFRGDDRPSVRVRDLLCHVSGLPDMLPENIELRRRHAPLADFVRQAYTTPLLFKPGTKFSYQSTGMLLAGTIVEKLAGMPLRKFEKREIFDPLGMKDSSLGLGGRQLSRVVEVESEQGSNVTEDHEFGLNSKYWRDLGAPWGGMHSTTYDLAVFLEAFLEGGVYGSRRIFSRATVTAMTSDQNAPLNHPWGLGWALGRSTEWNAFGDSVSSRTFGHAGATGTLMWADPDTKLICIILTNRPYDMDNGRLLRMISNVVANSEQN